MKELTRVTVDFETSHLVFPRIIAVVVILLGVAVLFTRRREILASGTYWRGVLHDMDKLRFLGTLALTIAYFSLMVPVGRFWPNTGLGFLFCSIPYIFLIGVLYLHDRQARQIVSVALTALLAPLIVWWLFTDLFFLTLP